MAERRLAGGCLCGAVRYEAREPLIWAGHCHCRMCQRAHGAGAVTWVSVPRATFRVEGPLGTYRSSSRATRQFCTVCGSPLFFNPDGKPGQVDIAAASLDGPAIVEPRSNIWVGTRQPWAVGLGAGLPAYEVSEPD